MPASQDRNTSSSVSIDPEANLAIYLYLRDGAQMLSEPPSGTIGHQDQSRTVVPPDRGPPRRPNTPSARLTSPQVLDMTLAQLENLQERVGQMEISNRALLTRIYGPFSLNHQPFPLIIASRMSSSEFPEPGSPQHRALLFSQYSKMLEIAKDPSRGVDFVEPASARGAKALQEYQMQLLLLAEHRRAQTKRKYEGQESSRRRPPPPRLESGYFKAMHENCRVLDFDPRPAWVDNRSDRAKQNSTALSDYQQQLMLLEEQNKKRLLLARQEQERSANARPGEEEGGSTSQRRKETAREDQSSLPIRQRRRNGH